MERSENEPKTIKTGDVTPRRQWPRLVRGRLELFHENCSRVEGSALLRGLAVQQHRPT